MNIAEAPGLSLAHLRDAREYLDDAEAAYEAGRYKACASNACISTIRSSDAVCVAELGQRWSGRSHAGATALLRTTSLRDRGAELLVVAAESKNATQYRIGDLPAANAMALLEGARTMLALAMESVARAGFPFPY